MGRRSTRKKIHREPNGRLAREPQRGVAPIEAKRLREAARAVRSAEYGTELGRLFLNDAISEVMYAAGKRLWRVSDAYRAAMRGPAMGRLSLDGGRSEPLDPDSEAGAAEAKRHAQAVQAYEAALGCMGQPEWRSVERVALDGVPTVGYQQHIDLRCGLLCLVHHFGLTNQKNRSVR